MKRWLICRRTYQLEGLDERKRKILQAIIRTYMETGEPVGSRTISKYTDLNLSSATIRNEMADLEELGYIIQPHTSAGRIPSDKGYRLYVDTMLLEKDKEVAEMKELMLEKTEKMEKILMQVAKLLANNTNYAAMISAPQTKRNHLKFIQLSQVDEEHILAVVVSEGNIVKNKVISVDEALDNETILKLNILLNSNLNGLAMEEINLATIARLKEQAGMHSQLLNDIMDAVAEAIVQDDDLEIYTSGATNIFKYPELSDSGKAKDILMAFEEKHQLAEIVNSTLENESETGIRVYIGEETPIQNMKDCSVVTATYELEEGVQGTVGIIGPKRMDYEKVVSNLKTLMGQLDDVFKRKKNKDAE